MDLEYKLNNTKPNVAEVKLIINGIPDSREIFDARTLNLICYNTNVSLPTNESTTTYIDNEENVLVSSTSLIHTGSKPATDIVIKKKNGKDEVIMSDGILADGVEKYQNNAITKYIFYNTIGPNEIDDVVIVSDGNAFKPDLTKTFMLAENSHIRKITYYEEKNDNTGITATVNIQWLQEPENKYTDYICLTYKNRYLKHNNVSITQSALKKTTTGGEELVTKPVDNTKICELFIINSPSLTDGESCIHIFNEFLKDTASETYTNHTLTIVFDMDYSGRKPDTFPIYCDYYHMLEDITTDSKSEIDLDKILKSTKCGKVGRYFGAY